MLINTVMRVVFNPSLYPGRLLVCVNTEDGKPELGVFSGRNAGFKIKEDMNVRQPTVIDETWSGAGLEVFEISVPPNVYQSSALHYAIIDWQHKVYVGYPVGRELVLSNQDSDHWHVVFAGVTVILPDYNCV